MFKHISNAIEMVKSIRTKGYYIRKYFTVDGQQPKVKVYTAKSDFEIFLN